MSHETGNQFLLANFLAKAMILGIPEMQYIAPITTINMVT